MEMGVIWNLVKSLSICGYCIGQNVPSVFFFYSVFDLKESRSFSATENIQWDGFKMKRCCSFFFGNTLVSYRNLFGRNILCINLVCFISWDFLLCHIEVRLRMFVWIRSIRQTHKKLFWDIASYVIYDAYSATYLCFLFYNIKILIINVLHHNSL